MFAKFFCLALAKSQGRKVLFFSVGKWHADDTDLNGLSRIFYLIIFVNLLDLSSFYCFNNFIYLLLINLEIINDETFHTFFYYFPFDSKL